MLGLLINVLIVLLILGVAWWVFNALAGIMGLPPVIVQVAQIVLVIVCLIVVINFLLGISGTSVSWHALR